MSKIYSGILVTIFPLLLLAQGPGSTFNPNPPDSSSETSVFINEISWTNPLGTTSIDVWIGTHPDYFTHIYSGAEITSLHIPSPQEYRKTYFWRVDASDQSGTTEGDTWIFTTTDLIVPTINFFVDSFSTGTSNWTITNDGGVCVWDTINLNVTNYDMPVTAYEQVLSADGSICGSGTTTLTTATLTNPVDLSQITQAFVLWDNDWCSSDSTDTAYVQLSNDFGNSWITFWERPGVNARKTQEFVEISGFISNDSLLFRFRTIQNGSNSWWAIDNFFVYGSDILSPPFPPRNLIADGYINSNFDTVWVELNWTPGGGVATGQRIKRKFGNQYSQYMYFTIKEVGLNTSSFLDYEVIDNSFYTYKIGIFEGPSEGSYSNESTAYVPDIITSVETKNELPTKFHLEQNYPNPFNPTTTIKYQIPEISFVTLKVYDVLGSEIETLINEEKPVGSYEVDFDASNLSSGIYFFRLKAGSFVETKKMVLLK